MSYTQFVQFVIHNSPAEVARRLTEFEAETMRWRSLSDYHRTKAELLEAENFELREKAEETQRHMERILSGTIPEMPAEKEWA